MEANSDDKGLQVRVGRIRGHEDEKKSCLGLGELEVGITHSGSGRKVLLLKALSLSINAKIATGIRLSGMYWLGQRIARRS